MINRSEVEKLAELSRLSLSDDELAELSENIKQVLVHVADLGTINGASQTEEIAGVRNVLREDGTPHEPGAFTEALTEAFPNKEGGYAKVEKIITRE